MVATRKLAEDEIVAQADQRVYLYGISWWQYETMLAVRGESARPRMTYLNGVLELMSPSDDHEVWKTVIARLVEAYAEEADLPLDGHGSVTMKRSELDRGAEADESYTLGPMKGDIVDLAIEVIKTSGGINKLEVYRGLGVREVWFYDRKGRFHIHALRGDRYEKIAKSEYLPDLDLDLLARFVRTENQTRAVREFRQALRAQKRPAAKRRKK